MQFVKNQIFFMPNVKPEPIFSLNTFTHTYIFKSLYCKGSVDTFLIFLELYRLFFVTALVLKDVMKLYILFLIESCVVFTLLMK